MGLSTTITELRGNEKLTDADREKMGTDGQIMLVKTLVTEDGGVPITHHVTEFYNTVEEAEAEAAKWKSE